jgi:hypothetical protein
MSSKNKQFSILAILILIFSIYTYYLLPSVMSWGHDVNYKNVSVMTKVNVTQALPEITNVTCNGGSALTLTAGGTKQMLCVVKIMDFNGGNTIANVNATFHYYLNLSTDPDDNNTHYTNTTCIENSTDGLNATWNCTFEILYYANNGTWIANITVKDDYNMTAKSTKNATISTLYALNVTDTIDFGSMAVGDTTLGDPIQANVTNLGNMNINVTVKGYAGDNETTGANYAMFCQYRNITIANERYNTSSSTYDDMTSLTGATTTIRGFTVLQQTNDAMQEINTTYWRLHVNATNNPFGMCNGTVVFGAIAP